jgi:hypothetical protein
MDTLQLGAVRPPSRPPLASFLLGSRNTRFGPSKRTRTACVLSREHRSRRSGTRSRMSVHIPPPLLTKALLNAGPLLLRRRAISARGTPCGTPSSGEIGLRGTLPVVVGYTATSESLARHPPLPLPQQRRPILAGTRTGPQLPTMRRPTTRLPTHPTRRPRRTTEGCTSRHGDGTGWGGRAEPLLAHSRSSIRGHPLVRKSASARS